MQSLKDRVTQAVYVAHQGRVEIVDGVTVEPDGLRGVHVTTRDTIEQFDNLDAARDFILGVLGVRIRER